MANQTALRLRKITSVAPINEIIELSDFLKTLDSYDENGFGWPKQLMDARNYEEIRNLLAQLEEAENFNIKRFQEKGYVPQEVFWAQNESGQIIGMVKLRSILTPKMLREGGHVGMGLTRSARGKGYGTAILGEALKICQARGLQDVLVTIHATNVASRLMVEANGGKVWDVIRRDGRDVARYWICLH